MQSLTAPPREHLSEAAVRRLLTGPSLHVAKQGLDLLDTSNRFVDDLSDDLAAGGSVSWDNRAAVHGSCNLGLQRKLVWGRDRVRPWVLLQDNALNPTISARFNLGVYIPTQPAENRAESPITYDVTGYNVLSLLQTGPADTWVAPAGDSYGESIDAIITASGTGLQFLLPTELYAIDIPATRVWAVFSPIPTWLRMLTDLLFEVGHTAPWADENGYLRTREIQAPATRAADWVLNTADPDTNIVAPDRTVAQETGDIPNKWVFVGASWPTTPVEGDGMYTVENLTEGDAAQERIERVVPKWVALEATDQTALVAQGDKIVAGDKAAARTIDLQIDSLPIQEFDDVYQFDDAGETEKVVAATWTFHLDGSAGQLQLGGAPREPLDVIEVQAKATVTSAAPLRVAVDGATVDSFANALNAAAYDVGDRVTVTIRNPLPPLVQGVES